MDHKPANKRYNYVLRIEYLGFRYSGWQRQPGQRTIEGMIYKTLKFIAPGRRVRILGAGRTDARVSAMAGAFQLFVKGQPLDDPDKFLAQMNLNLPADIRVTGMNRVADDFNIIQHCIEKEYRYFFSFGDKKHPFSAPFIAHINNHLDIELMKDAASLFTGIHNFKSYTVRSAGRKEFIRHVSECRIEENTVYSANFFPEKSFMLSIKSAGFLRYQVRMIMGALIQLGKGELSVEAIQESLSEDSDMVLTYIAPGSGLMLQDLKFRSNRGEF